MIHPVQLGIAGGIVWGGCMFISTFLALYFDWGRQFLEMMSGIYPGYQITLLGSIVGLVYGFFDAFIGLILLGWIYNRLTR